VGLRIRRSIKLSKHTRLNLSKSGISVSTGIKGARVSINNKGVVRKSIGVPGTGVYYTEQHKLNSNSKAEENKMLDKNLVYDSTTKPKSKWLPLWVSNWMLISFLIMILGFIGTATKGLLILLLPVGMVSLLISLIIYMVFYIRFKKNKE